MDTSQVTVEEMDRRKRLEKYRTLINFLESREEELVKQDLLGEEGNNENDGKASAIQIQGKKDILARATKEINHLFKDVNKVDEGFLDLRALSTIGRIVRRRTETYSTNTETFTPSQFANKVIAAMKGYTDEAGDVHIPRENWILLGKRTQCVFSKPSSFSYLYGAIDQTEYERKEPKKRPKLKNDRNLIPTVANHLSQPTPSESLTEVLVSSILKKLVEEYISAGRKPINFFKFVIDPESFSATVENTFHVAFLVKDGKLAIEIDEASGLPTIKPIPEKERCIVQDDGTPVPKNQVVLEWTMQYWEDLKTALNIKAPTIKRTYDITGR